MKKPLKSKCCNAPMKEVGMGDFHDKDEVCTMYWECQSCYKPCDPQETMKNPKYTQGNIKIRKEEGLYYIDCLSEPWDLILTEVELRDLELCLLKMKGYEVKKIEIPMGVSEWKNHGIKYQYDKYFGIEFKGHILRPLE